MNTYHYRGLPGKVSSKKEHVYITAPVRKKEDKKKLDGWECKDCAQVGNDIFLNNILLICMFVNHLQVLFS